MSNNAVRIGDLISCPMQTPVPPGGTVPHCPGPGLPLIPPPQPTAVLIENQPAATITDKSMCVSPAGPLPNPIISGALMVLIGNKPAARKSDFLAHPGSKAVNHAMTVQIGGPATAGNVPLGIDDCHKLAQGRTSGQTGQSYGNCGIESCRSIINRANNSNVSEDAMLSKAVNNGLASKNGGTSPSKRHDLLESYGVDAVLSPAQVSTLPELLAEGRGIVASIWAARTWPATNVVASGAVPGDEALPHAVRVTGVTLDADGNPDTVYVLDTSGIDNGCAYPIPAAVFSWAIRPGRDFNVTENPIW